jgi:hypothetical protein
MALESRAQSPWCSRIDPFGEANEDAVVVDGGMRVVVYRPSEPIDLVVPTVGVCGQELGGFVAEYHGQRRNEQRPLHGR